MSNVEVKITKTIGGSLLMEKTEKAVISKEDIDDILSSALEGASIAYWCNRAEVVEENYFGEYGHEQISRGGSIRLHDGEENEDYILTLDKFMKGIKLAMEDGYGEKWFVNGKLDGCQIDGVMADVIVQFAIFGEVIYG